MKIVTEWDFKKFDAKDYLSEFYSGDLQDDLGEDFSLHWFQMIYDWLRPTGKLLEFGGGPTIYSLITAAKYVDEIHFSDYAPACLDEIRAWKNNLGHNWSVYIKRAMELEKGKVIKRDIMHRERLIQQKINRIFLLDEREKPTKNYFYDVVGVHFVPESTTGFYEDFVTYLNNILMYLKPGGLLMMGALKETSEYKVGDRWYSAARINEQRLERVLTDFRIKILKMASITTYDKERHVGGYLYAAGYKK